MHEHSFPTRRSSDLDLPEKYISESAMEVLKAYSWPGNIRQLENLLERTVMLVRGDVIEIEDLPEEVRRAQSIADNTSSKIAVGPDLEAMEKAYIYYTLANTGWNKSQTAKILGIDLSTLYRKIERYDLSKKP
jgi:DNA-binding NtrC family response regulator